VKTEAVAPARVRYRSETVFRSAKRLAASTPRQPVTPRRLGRPGFFIVGLVAGLALAVLLVPRVRDAVFRAVSSDSGFEPTPRHRLNPPRTTNGPTAFPLPAPPISTVPGDAASTPTTASPEERAPLPATPPARVPAPRPAAAAPLPASRVVAPVFVLPASTTRVALKGELRFRSTAAPIPVEFMLEVRQFRSGTSAYLEGVVTLSGDGSAPQSFRVVGNFLNRIFSLSSPTNTRRDSTQPAVRYAFIIELPNPATGSTAITGIWTHGTEQGVMVLESVVAL
jgi:hypothetical protein